MKPVLAKAVTLAVLALAVVLGWFAWDYYTRAPWTRDARVRADVVTLSAEVAGRIIELPVQDNQFVRQGDLLLQIDPARYELAVLHAVRAVEVARAALGQSQAAIVANEAQLKQRRSEEQRRRKLQSMSAISAEEWEKAGTDVAVAQADLLREQSNLGLAQANVQLAEATLQQARLDLERTRVSAPVSGYVTNLLTRQGDYAQPGMPLLALVDSSSFHVSGYFEETKLPKIKVGSRARIALMSGEVLDGTVESIAYAITDRENQPGNRLLANVNPSYTWVKLAQRIPVRLRLERSADAPPLRAGTTATVTILE
ncbi:MULTISPECIES: HlyD family secretion protein [Pseudomonas]|uniref:HlyD family secretion protein n=1 Tax=Pseudomonas asiatica TaxID=2219225 RepID=A0A9X4CX39_9PSED|nr:MULTISPECIES: HlyD family secretion protein [Pseudomonas]MEE1903184.1 HlyD family secretion protein [Pseudomonas inefficax]MDD2105616.1 HlyD family secretion protein [Pseudomonas asiatica]MDD2111625.1 HlyD family secretion protein [Pseudomonas asiatica]MDV5098798.1 HlyD family secretion protein [Pseudomonas sp. LSJ-87]MEE1908271.1 HlyD family secretion protein [Pseudomonas inefficax]